MIPSISTRIARAASSASNLGSLCEYLSAALGGDPVTANASEAIDGLRELALNLSNILNELAEDAA